MAAGRRNAHTLRPGLQPPCVRVQVCSLRSRPAMPSATASTSPSPAQAAAEAWAFAEPADTVAFTSSRVTGEGHPVLLVVHGRNGEWQFLHGPVESGDRCRIVCLGSVVERDSSLAALADLPRGWRAYRALPDGNWTREPNDSPLQSPDGALCRPASRRKRAPLGWTQWFGPSSLPDFWLWK